MEVRMIRAEVVGNVGKKPELKDTKNGKQMCRFSVASTKKVEGREPVTSWVSVLCFDEQAVLVSEKVAVGDRVMVTGRLEVEKYEQDGVERTSVTLVADDVGISLKWPKRAREQAASTGEEDWKNPF
jgi:single-strand DNA-binding protein